MFTIFDCVKIWEEWRDYLEKKNSSDLGDMTPSGKSRNAGYNNYTLYAKWYDDNTGENYQGQAYCAMAESMSFVKAYGLKTAKALLGGDLYYNCESFYKRIKNSFPERLHSSPEVGDVELFFNGSRHHHTGHVIKLLTNGWVSMEANTSSGNNVVVPNGGATTKKSYTTGQVSVVFYRPPYSEYGISPSEEEDITTYYIKTGQGGLRVTASELAVRLMPDINAKLVGTVKAGDRIYPTEKAFDDRGVRWYYSPEKCGWISGKYLTGWIRESGNGKWWYLTEGDSWHSGTIEVIDGVPYGFDDTGYMITEPFTVHPDSTGKLCIR